jgi:uncharacterized membrane protein
MSPPPANTRGPRRIATRALISYTLRTLRLVLASSPGLLFAMAALTLVSAVVPIVIAYAGKRIIDAVVAADVELSVRSPCAARAWSAPCSGHAWAST